MIITTEMARTLLLVVLANHVEKFDGDCMQHFGCSCGWEPQGLNANAHNWEDDEEAKLPRSRRLWQEHLASVILGMKEK